MARRHVMTPRRKAALRKAQLASAKKRRKGVSGKRKVYGQTKNRPTGLSGLARTTTPYVRVNKRSQTVGFNSGTVIPFTNKRIAFGSYFRLESTTRRTATDRAIAKAVSSVAPKGSKRGKAAGFLKNNVHVTTPAVRVSAGKAQVRLGTSRGAGPTVIIRRGSHKTGQIASQRGVSNYQSRMRTIQKSKKKSRTQRRKKR